MSEALNILYMDPFKNLIKSFEQQKNRYESLRERHKGSLTDLRSKC